jgi:hypothetical protein
MISWGCHIQKLWNEMFGSGCKAIMIFMEKEEHALLNMVAFVNSFNGSLAHHFIPMVLVPPLEKRVKKIMSDVCTCGKSLWSTWSPESIANEIACLWMTETI